LYGLEYNFKKWISLVNVEKEISKKEAKLGLSKAMKIKEEILEL